MLIRAGSLPNRYPEWQEKKPLSLSFCFMFLAVCLLLGRECFAAPLRVYLPYTWYIPDIVLSLFVCFFFLKEAMRSPLIPSFLGLIIIVWIMISSFFLEPLSILFALRPFLALMLGIAAAKEGLLDNPKMRLILAVFLCAIVGSLLYDQHIGFGWENGVFDSVLGQKAVSRLWWSDQGIRRLSGFAMASTDAAFIIATLLLLFIPNMIRFRLFVGLPFLLLCVYALWLTNQKATMSITFFLCALTGLSLFVRSKDAKKILVTMLKALALTGLIVCIAAPFVFLNVDIGSFFGQDAPSLKERTVSVWPMAISRLFSFPTLFTGSGFGSVGDSASFTDAALAIPPDNMFLFLSIHAGLFVSFACAIAVFRTIMRADAGKEKSLSCLSIAALFLFNGITANILAGVVSSFYMGYALIYLLRNQENPDQSSLKIARKIT